jgi:hypothetical protein
MSEVDEAKPTDPSIVPDFKSAALRKLSELNKDCENTSWEVDVMLMEAVNV